MILKAIIDEQVYTLNVPEPVMARGIEFFDQLDRDMDQGWQMSREWVESPDRLQRCQIIADKLLTALEKENEKLGMLMAGYILNRLPNVDSVELDLQGEVHNNQFHFKESATSSDAAITSPAAEDRSPSADAGLAAASAEVPSGMNKMQAMAQAGQDVTQVFKVGKAYRFSVYDHASGSWQDSPMIATEAEAERLRQQAFKARYEALQRA
ncbi:MAG: hypothetical protein C1943_03760 [Halochromatium sp.]|nr:hypothetical protein [Halochromatium sp.]